MSGQRQSSDMTPSQRIGKNIVEARHRAGFSQDRLAFFCGLHRTEISLIERGGRTPRTDTLIRVADSLEVSFGSLVEGVHWIPDERVKGGTFRVFEPLNAGR